MSAGPGGLTEPADDAEGRRAWTAYLARAEAVATADPEWRATHLAAVRASVTLEQELTARWSDRVRCLYVHTEIGRVAMVFAGHHTLRDEVLWWVDKHPGLRGSFIPLDDDGLRLRVGVARPPPCGHAALTDADKHFIDFLVEQAIRAWTSGT